MEQGPNTHKAWHSRGYLPHCDIPNIPQGITFRLADSVPDKLILQWEHELNLTENSAPSDESRVKEQREILRQRIAKFEDSGFGECHLRNSEIAKLVLKALKFFHGQRYDLKAWCIMPNHVHVLIHTHAGFPLGKIVQSWKSRSAKQANALLARKGEFWAADYFDRYIRDGEHYAKALNYIHANPVKAGLCIKAEDWPWSSAAPRGSAE